MKKINKIVLTITILSSIASTSFANSSDSNNVTCRVITGDVGDIISYGNTKKDALERAQEACFDRRVQLYESRRSASIDDERGMDIIDSCVNLKCS